jgi:hypothetical protein
MRCGQYPLPSETWDLNAKPAPRRSASGALTLAGSRELAGHGDGTRFANLHRKCFSAWSVAQRPSFKH